MMQDAEREAPRPRRLRDSRDCDSCGHFGGTHYTDGTCDGAVAGIVGTTCPCNGFVPATAAREHGLKQPQPNDGDEVCLKCGRRADGHPYTDDEIGSRRCLYPLTSAQRNDGDPAR